MVIVDADNAMGGAGRIAAATMAAIGRPVVMVDKSQVADLGGRDPGAIIVLIQSLPARAI